MTNPAQASCPDRFVQQSKILRFDFFVGLKVQSTNSDLSIQNQIFVM